MYGEDNIVSLCRARVTCLWVTCLLLFGKGDLFHLIATMHECFIGIHKNKTAIY